MQIRRLLCRRDLKNVKPAKRLKIDGLTLKRAKLKPERPPKPSLPRSYRIAYPLVFLSLCLYFLDKGKWSLYRFAGAVYDLVLSILEYVLRVAHVDVAFLPIRINDIPDVPYVPFLPLDGNELEGFWARYIAALFDGDRFLLYTVDCLVLLLRAQQLLLPGFLIWLIVWLLRHFREVEINDDFGRYSTPVQICRWLGARLAPCARWIYGLWTCASFRFIAWSFVVILVGTNGMTIIVELIAELFHLSVSADYQNLYVQLYKLLLDITVGLDTLPTLVWILIGYKLSKIFRRCRAFQILERTEELVRAFIARLPLLVLITGKVGIGKTQSNVNLTLSFQDAHRDRMKESMLDIRGEFPEYPWSILDQQIGIMYFCGDLKGKMYTRDLFTSLIGEDDDLFYGYAGRRVFSDGVIISHLRDRIVDYAELQYMYRVQCLIFSSYSLRVDATYIDHGKLPAWSCDYFRSPAFDPHGDAQRAHVGDFDLLRLGKPVDPASPAGAWEFGVWSHTEMGKDYGNSLTNKDLKESAPTSNIKNDLLVDRLKIKRHSSTACFTPYTQYIGDEQRPSSLQADVLELTNVIQIKGTSGSKSAYHLFLFERFFRDLLLSLWHGWYAERSIYRADVDLPTFFLQKLMDHYNPKIREHAQLFGYEMLDVNLRDGEDMDAEPELIQLPVSYKKCRAGRYGTDCYRDVLAERAARFDKNIYAKIRRGEELTDKEQKAYECWEHDTARTYSADVATPDEIRAQHSRFGDKILKVGKHYED